MPHVNLFLIGVNKAGTSWLYDLLRQHPDIFMSEVKELYFFGDEGLAAERPPTLDAYHAHFPFDEPYRYFGDATVMYYRRARTAAEIHAYNPDATCLAIVRDPVERLLSQYRYHKQLGLLDETMTVEDVFDVSDSRLFADSRYETTLPAYADRFGRDQFTVLSLERGREDLEALWDKLTGVLDLPSRPLPSLDARPQNPTGSLWFRRLYRHTVRPIRRMAPGVYRWMLTSSAVHHIKRGLLRLLGTADADAVPPDLRRRLREEFAPTYAYLRDELGFDVYDGRG